MANNRCLVGFLSERPNRVQEYAKNVCRQLRTLTIQLFIAGRIYQLQSLAEVCQW